MVSFLLTLVAGWEVRQASRATTRAEIAADKAKQNEDKAKKAEDAARYLAYVANRSEVQAKAQARIATSRSLAFLSESERSKRLDRSLLLAVEALRARLSRP